MSITNKMKGGVNMGYYDGTKLLSMLDINNEKPEIYICTTNRNAGKTTYYNRYCVNRFKKFGEKFCVIYRYDYEMGDVDKKFFDEIGRLFFPDDSMTFVRKAKGTYGELFLNGVSCGYAVALNKADQIKKHSHLLSDTVRMIFDEFQSETNNYVPNEITKFISVHTSIARGGGKQIKYLPVIMLSNAITILNPYFTAMDIANRLRSDTKYLKGDGYVLESGYYEEVANMQRNSAFNRAFKNDKYVAYASENVYLNDNASFIEKLEGKNSYYCTFVIEGKNFAIREFPEIGYLYVNKNVDSSYPIRICASADSHNVNYVMLKRNDAIINVLRQFFEHGSFRFKDMESKDALLKLLCY